MPNGAPTLQRAEFFGVFFVRRVLDQQLQNTIYQFEHKTGVVEKIDEDTRQLARALPVRRRLVYRMRSAIARWSNRMFLLARALKAPRLYLSWAKASLRLYQGVTWSRGRIGRALDRLFPSPEA